MSYVVDHPILDKIARCLQLGTEDLRRESECLEFVDGNQWYEIVVRPIDGPCEEN